MTKQKRLIQMLTEAGSGGLLISEVCAKLGGTPRNVRGIVTTLRNKGHQIQTMRLSSGSRFYIGGNGSSRPAREELHARIVDAGQNGATPDQLSQDMSRSTFWASVRILKDAGRVFYSRWPGASQETRYFARADWMEAALDAAWRDRSERLRAVERVKLAKLRTRPTKPAPAKPVGPSGPVINPGVEATILPGFDPARRFAGNAPSIFGSLAVGSYLPAETWATKVYG